MKWLEIKTHGLPPEEDEFILMSHPWMDDSVLVYGYDHINFSPRTRIIFINDVAKAKSDQDGNYMVDDLIITHWQFLKRPR